MKNESTDQIVSVVNAFLASCNVSDMQKISTAFLDSWKEYLNGNASSQLEADKKLKKSISDIVEDLPENGVEYIAKFINK